ncbi:hypothetical protein NEOKW01_0696 [Nematocida sp. AWRm80]|nr:hypothetical protein NEOKW01_0696 [Nematocida sp. AWRm80]
MNFLVILLVVAVSGYSDGIDIGFFILPKNNDYSDDPYTLALGDMGLQIMPLTKENRDHQIFIRERAKASKVCLKAIPNLCIKIDKNRLDKRISFFFKRSHCYRGLKKSKLVLRRTEYHKLTMLSISGCKDVCLFSHSKDASPGSTAFRVGFDFCSAGNINNLFYTVSEEDIVEHIAERQPIDLQPPIETDPLNSNLLSKLYLANELDRLNYLHPLVPAARRDNSTGNTLTNLGVSNPGKNILHIHPDNSLAPNQNQSLPSANTMVNKRISSGYKYLL